jgi:hypothetical protein
MHIKPRLILFCIAFFLFSVNLFAQSEKPKVLGKHFILKISAGADYSTSTTILFFFKIPIYPQIACWIETAQGTYVDTIYVTSKGAKKNFFSASSSGRPEALPVWYHIQQSKPINTDAVTSATSANSAEHESQSFDQLKSGKYVVKVEINRSYDYNDQYTRTNSGVNGQPSLIYRAEIDIGDAVSSAELVPFGVGSADGSDGSIRPGLDGITTALKLIDKAEIEYVTSQ